jgi:GTP1/Obg family GTP-binding protein
VIFWVLMLSIVTTCTVILNMNARFNQGCHKTFKLVIHGLDHVLKRSQCYKAKEKIPVFPHTILNFFTTVIHTSSKTNFLIIVNSDWITRQSIIKHIYTDLPFLEGNSYYLGHKINCISVNLKTLIFSTYPNVCIAIFG